MSKAIDHLSAQGSLPKYVPGSLKLFMDVRNKIVHGQEASDDDALRAIDSGLTILKAIDVVPAETNTVYHVGVPIFSDPECKDEIPGAKGIILETTSPGGATKTFRIFPTTRSHFTKGTRVSWEWNLGNTWARTWYKNPDDGEIRQAWHSSAEFIGRTLDDP